MMIMKLILSAMMIIMMIIMSHIASQTNFNKHQMLSCQWWRSWQMTKVMTMLLLLMMMMTKNLPSPPPPPLVLLPTQAVAPQKYKTLTNLLKWQIVFAISSNPKLWQIISKLQIVFAISSNSIFLQIILKLHCLEIPNYEKLLQCIVPQGPLASELPPPPPSQP